MKKTDSYDILTEVIASYMGVKKGVHFSKKIRSIFGMQ